MKQRFVIFRKSTTLFCDLFLLMHSITLSGAAKQFIKMLMWERDWVQVNKRYLALKQLCNMMNETIGLNMTAFLTDSIIYFAYLLHRSFLDNKTNLSVDRFILLTFSVGNTCGILLVAADIPHKVISFCFKLKFKQCCSPVSLS